MKVEVTLLKCGAVGATGSLALEPFMYFQIWQGNFNVIKDGFDLKCRSRAEKIFTGLVAGQQHVSSCQAQLPASTAAPWVGAVCSGCTSWGGPITCALTDLKPCWISACPWIILLCHHCCAYIIQPLWALTFFFFFFPSLSFEWIKVIWCEIAGSPRRTERIFWTTGHWLFLKEYFSRSTKKTQILYLRLCFFFFFMQNGSLLLLSGNLIF